MRSHTQQNEPWELCEMQTRDPTGNLTFVYKTNKMPVFLNSAKNALFSLSVFSRPACVAAFLLIRPCQEVEQMLPWHPSGPRTPALPPTADAPRRTPHIPGPSQRGGCSHDKKGSPPTDPGAVTQHRHQPGCCFHSWYMCVSDWPSGFMRGVSSLFQHSHSHTHTPLWKTNTNDGNASIWCKLVRKCSLDQIIISRYEISKESQHVQHFDILTGVTRPAYW